MSYFSSSWTYINTNTPLLSTSLSSRMEVRTFLHEVRKIFPGGVLGKLFFHTTRTSVTGLPCLFTKRLSTILILSFAITPSSVNTSKGDWTGKGPTCFFNWETWKTGWILEDSGNSSLYAIGPIFSVTQYGLKNFARSFKQCRFTTVDWWYGWSLTYTQSSTSNWRSERFLLACCVILFWAFCK